MEKRHEKDNRIGATNPIVSFRNSTRTDCPGNRPGKGYCEVPSAVRGIAGPNLRFRTGKWPADRGEKFVVGNQKAKIEDLVGLKGKSVTVKYRAERKGNKANELVVP